MSKLLQAQSLLREMLTNRPIPSQELIETAKQYGISRRTLVSAKRLIGVVSTKSSFDGQWMWSLPEKSNNSSAPTQECKTVKNISKAMFVAFDQQGEKPIPIRVLPGEIAKIPWSRSAEIALIGGVLEYVNP